MQHNRYWLHADGTVNNQPHAFTQPRPVAVIDPADDSQVDRLIELVLAHGYAFKRDTVADMPAALRKYAEPNPPKPDEPTGLGAVVEEAGDEWVHFGNGMWIKAVPNAGLLHLTWDQFRNDVKVLSLGRPS